MPAFRFLIPALAGIAFTSLSAAEGDLDPAFGDSGVFPFNGVVAGLTSSAAAAAVDDDGRLVVAGRVDIEDQNDIAIYRFRPDGQLDTSFSGDGRHVVAPTTYNDAPVGVAFDSQGRVLVAVEAGGPGFDSDFGIIRLRPDGTLDDSFGTGGIFVHDLHGDYEGPNDLTVDASDRPLVAGYARPGGSKDVCVLRYTTAGALDPTFGTEGAWVHDLGTTIEELSGIAVDSQGRIVASGEFAPRDGIVIRLTTDGTLDTAFGGDGKTSFRLSNRTVGLHGDVAVTSDDSVLWTGLSWDNTGSGTAFGVAKLTSSGELDTSFGGGDGKVLEYLGGQSRAFDLFSQDNGKIVMVGWAERDGMGQPSILRLEADGAVDTGFGDNGRRYLGNHSTVGGTLDPASGRIYAFGTGREDQQNRVYIEAVDATGAIDTGFGDGGTVHTAIQGRSTDHMVTTLRQDDGKIITVGHGLIASKDRLAVARRLADGRADRTWSSDGIWQLPDVDAVAQDAELLANGRVLVLARVYGDVERSALLVRLDANGSLDTGFGNGGIVDLSDATYAGLTTDLSGRILLTGSLRDVNNDDLMIRRLTAEGAVDASFGSGGFTVVDSAPGHTIQRDRLNDAVVQATGDIIAVGQGGGGREAFLVTRFENDGTHDTSFGTDGFMLRPDLSQSNWDTEALGALLLDDDRVLVLAMAADQAWQGRLGAVMLAADGSLDTAFGTDGVVLLDVDTDARELPYGATTYGDGFLIAGAAIDGNRADARSTAVLVHLDADGTPVSSFGASGGAVYHSPDFQAAAGVVTDGTYAYLGGHGAEDFALARVLLGTTSGNAPVIAEGDSVSVSMDEDSSPTAFALDLTASDSDGDPLIWDIAVAASNGTASVGSGIGTAQAIAYQPDADYYGDDQFTVLVSDGLLTDTIVVHVSISPQDDDPDGVPEITVTIDGSTVDDGVTIDGPELRLGSGSEILSVRIANDGTGNLLLHEATIQATSGCSAQIGTPVTSLAPGNTDTLDLELTPGTEGPYSCTFQITSSDSDESSISITVTGTVSAAPLVPRSVELRLQDASGAIDALVIPDRADAALSDGPGEATTVDWPDNSKSVRIGFQAGIVN